MLAQLLADTLADGESRWVLAHLLGRCKPCLRAMRAALDRWRVRPALANISGRSADAYAAGPLEAEGDDGPEAHDGIATRSLERSAAGAAAIPRAAAGDRKARGAPRCHPALPAPGADRGRSPVPFLAAGVAAARRGCRVPLGGGGCGAGRVPAGARHRRAAAGGEPS